MQGAACTMIHSTPLSSPLQMEPQRCWGWWRVSVALALIAASATASSSTPKAHHTRAAAACERSGYCSHGKVPGYVGDITEGEQRARHPPCMSSFHTQHSIIAEDSNPLPELLLIRIQARISEYAILPYCNHTTVNVGASSVAGETVYLSADFAPRQ